MNFRNRNFRAFSISGGTGMNMLSGLSSDLKNEKFKHFNPQNSTEYNLEPVNELEQ